MREEKKYTDNPPVMLLRNGSITGEIIEVSAGYGKK
jgi:hypothetical protein